MKNYNKTSYVPCQLKVVSFEVENEFAQSKFTNNPIGTQTTLSNTLYMKNRSANGDYQNQQYQTEGSDFDWFGKPQQ